MYRRVRIRRATRSDEESILEILSSNRRDASLFQQPPRQVRATLADFIVATDDAGHVRGCAALHQHRVDNAEILAVAVDPDWQRRGIGLALMGACLLRAVGFEFLWLATAKPSYFARFGFQPISRWSLPLGVLYSKLKLIFQQPSSRWLPAVFGRHTFMRRRRPYPFVIV